MEKISEILTKECPCCGNKFILSEDGILNISKRVGAETLSKETVYKGVVFQRRFAEISTNVEHYQEYETYVCKDCLHKYNRIKTIATTLSVILVVSSIVILPIIGFMSDLALLIILAVFALIFVKGYYKLLYELFWKIFSSIFARGIDFAPTLQHIMDCGTSPSLGTFERAHRRMQLDEQIEALSELSKDENGNDLPF